MNMTLDFPEADPRQAAVPADAQAQPLRWWPAAGLDRLTVEVQGVLAQWAREWGLPAEASDIACAPQVMVASDHFHGAGGADAFGQTWVALCPGNAADGCWWTVDAQTRDSWAGATQGGHGYTPRELADAVLQASLFATAPDAPAMMVDPPTPRVSASVAAEAREDWCARLRKWLGVPAEAEPTSVAETQGALPRGMTQPWSGAVWLAVGWCGLRFQLAMSFSHIVRLLGQHSVVSTDAETAEPVTRPALVPVLSALSAEALSVTVELSPVRLELGVVAGLRLGDVVRLPHALDRPLRVRVGDAPPLFQAFLGQIDEHKAVELQPFDVTHESAVAVATATPKS